MARKIVKMPQNLREWRKVAFYKALKPIFYGPVVKWHNATFALWRREFDSPQVQNKGLV